MSVNTAKSKRNTAYIKPVQCDRVDQVIIDIKKSIIINDYKSVILDLTDFNLFDSIRIGTLVATIHFVHFLNGKVTIIVDDNLAQKTIENFKLKNTSIVLIQRGQKIYHIA